MGDDNKPKGNIYSTILGVVAGGGTPLGPAIQAFLPSIGGVLPSVPDANGLKIGGSSKSVLSSDKAVADYIRDNGASNPDFLTSTAGALTSQLHNNKPITRGFIRSSAPGGSASSGAYLKFMYNPETITRDYISYMDQAALDPFNTAYDSGNLIVAPNFLNFSFSLIFDRQIETAKGMYSRGVLVDYDYFDLVVRNIPPSGSNTVDNGIMMANPRDITVVFSEELTVQGRPTNARVEFTKFHSNMVPIRMEVTLNMVITYFGPIRSSYQFDSAPTVGTYAPLVPYGEVYPETYTEAQLEEATRNWQEGVDAKLSESRSRGKESAFSSVSNTAATASIANAEAAALTVAKVREIIATGAGYSSDPAHRYGPNTYDSGGLVSAAYQRAGLLPALTGGLPSSATDIYRAAENTGFRNMAVVMKLGPGTGNNVLTSCRIGDLLVRVNHPGYADHISIYTGPAAPSGLRVAHATLVGCVEEVVGVNFVDTFTCVLRLTAVGSSSIAAGAGGSLPAATNLPVNTVTRADCDTVPGTSIVVHKSILANATAMISDMRAAGHNINGGGFRDAAGQIATRRRNCGPSNYDIYEKPSSACSTPTARPGRSMHERGLAMDLTINGTTIKSRSSSAFQWLSANAHKYGFKNLPSEPWHWSTNGN